MRGGKELEWHPQGSGKPIDFGIGRQAHIGFELR